MSLIDTARLAVARRIAPERDALGFAEWLQYFSFTGSQYPLLQQGTLNSKQELPSGTFESYVQMIYKRNGVIFACMAARMMLFSQARFQFRRRRGGRPGELFGSSELAILERPWSRATTGDLLARTIQHADLAGNFFGVRIGKMITPARPDWMTVVVGSKTDADNPNWQLDAEVAGYMYEPGGRGAKKPVFLLPEEVCHYAPTPDPSFRFRGMSWLTPVINEVLGDQAATEHKLKFFENGATPNMVVSLDKGISLEQFKLWRKAMQEKSEGIANAYKTLYLGGGSTATPVGANLRQVDFKVVQGAGETRIAAAAGVPPIIVGLSEGLNAATYSNYGQAKRAFGDGTMAYLWQNMAASYAYIVTVPSDAELWYDDRDIPFLQEDVKDAADVRQVEAQTIKSLIDAGYKPDDVVDAVTSGDFTRLRGKHTGLYSVQLQPPQPKTPPSPPALPPGPAVPPPTPAPTAPAPRATSENGLTQRQTHIGELLEAGKRTKEIAAELDVSERTVERDAAIFRQWRDLAA